MKILRKSDKKNKALYEKLESEILYFENERLKYQVHLNSTLDEIKAIEGNLQTAESHVKNADTLETINNRIKNIEENVAEANKSINENYTTSLFDEKWIAIKFEPIHKEFADKVNS